jgi:hypothetical protein
VEGVPTTIPVHRWILESPEFRAGEHTTTWLERALVDVNLPGGQHIYLKLHGVTALAAERLQKIHYFLTLPGLWFRSPGAGFGIVHLSAAIKFTAYPGPPEVPAEAWLANK